MENFKANALKIEEIYRTFIHHQKFYILFMLNNSAQDFLYFLHLQEDLFSLFYGSELNAKICKLLNDPAIDCLECALGTSIKGGVSWDKGDLVNFNLDLETANHILTKLKFTQEQIDHEIKFFPEIDSQ